VIEKSGFFGEAGLLRTVKQEKSGFSEEAGLLRTYDRRHDFRGV
jgi:hypothetical protein